MKKITCFVLFLCLSMTHLLAQSASENTEIKRYARTQKRFTFAIQPLQAFNNALRYDFEFRLGDGPGWLQLGPAFYFNSRDKNSGNADHYYEGNNYYYSGYFENWQWREPYSKLQGIGVDINYKHFLDARRSFYFAVGFAYARFNIKYWSREWQDFTEDGLMYTQYGERYNTQNINRYGINNFIGYQIPARHAFLFDVFGGYAIRFAFADDDKPSFNRDMFSYGYSGIVAMLGFRIGFGIR